MRCLNVTPAEASAELTIAASRISEKGRTFDCGSDLTFSEIHRRVAWDMVGLLVGQELQIATTNPCPIEADICLSQFAQSTYGFPSAIRSRHLFGGHNLLRERDPIGVADEPAAQGCKAARNRFLIGLDMTLRPRERPM